MYEKDQVVIVFDPETLIVGKLEGVENDYVFVQFLNKGLPATIRKLRENAHLMAEDCLKGDTKIEVIFQILYMTSERVTTDHLLKAKEYGCLDLKTLTDVYNDNKKWRELSVDGKSVLNMHVKQNIEKLLEKRGFTNGENKANTKEYDDYNKKKSEQKQRLTIQVEKDGIRKEETSGQLRLGRIKWNTKHT
eukprot:TRINITY_DN9934_c0_g1_i1.p1 TRINITY_DN9934_c0_g1~~TRINITY_DN9934_c0_g1_i1.p1  ORF type:complete len:191 (-),score=29.65 TRINITY_DN9934_c0_g1_i1:197-769(-)